MAFKIILRIFYPPFPTLSVFPFFLTFRKVTPISQTPPSHLPTPVFLISPSQHLCPTVPSVYLPLMRKNLERRENIPHHQASFMEELWWEWEWVATVKAWNQCLGLNRIPRLTHSFSTSQRSVCIKTTERLVETRCPHYICTPFKAKLKDLKL